MASSPSWLPAVADALGAPASLRPASGSLWRLRVRGRELAAKAGPGVADEAAGLRRIGGVAGGPAVPDVVYADAEVMVTAWVPAGVRSPDQEETLGRGLAALHATPAEGWGGGSHWIGACPVDPVPADDGVAFYRRRLGDLARRAGLGAEVAPLLDRLDELVPFARPALCHGDLWWGNVVWGADGRPWVIDPSHHHGHPEEDLAMLRLFGPVPGRLLAAYLESRPLADGWESRVELWQLYPLLVHTVLFGGAYRARAEAVARRYR